MSKAFYPVGLRAARLDQRVTATAMAKLISVTPNSYHRFEGGTRQMSFSKVCMLADHLGISLDALRVDPDLVVSGRNDLGEWETPEA